MHRTASPDTSDTGIEQEIVAKGKTAPRVTSADIEAEIVGCYYFTADDGLAGAHFKRRGHVEGMGDAHEELRLLTFCVLVLRNGFTVTGESACASPENFDAEIGRKLARAKSVDKVWTLLGFRLRDRIVGGEFDTRVVDARPPYQQRVIAERAELSERTSKLHAFILDNPAWQALPDDEKARLQEQAELQGRLRDVLDARIAAFPVDG
jgi:hypothetical protein